MKKNIVFGLALAFSIGCIPFIAMADSSTDIAAGAANVSLLTWFLRAVLNRATGLILGAAVVFFLWGVFQFVRSAGDAEARKIGKDHIIWGTIGLAVIVSMWGLVNFVTGSLQLNTTTTVQVPKLPTMQE